MADGKEEAAQLDVGDLPCEGSEGDMGWGGQEGCLRWPPTPSPLAHPSPRTHIHTLSLLKLSTALHSPVFKFFTLAPPSIPRSLP